MLRRQLPAGAVDHLVEAGLVVLHGACLELTVLIVEAGGVLAVVPKEAWGPEVVYLGRDSAHLAEAALRLTPSGHRAAELGTGTGLLAAILASRYRQVVATDLPHSVTSTAQLTLVLNRYPAGHTQVVCRSDAAGGLRPGCFDLVASNPPWVPVAASGDQGDERAELFRHGGDTVEVPARFVRESASLLRPGGVAITLALDVALEPIGTGTGTEGRPLRDLALSLESDGYVVRLLPTPFNREQPDLLARVRERQPRVLDATQVAVVVARPRRPGDRRGSLLVAADALSRRWATRPVPTLR